MGVIKETRPPQAGYAFGERVSALGALVDVVDQAQATEMILGWGRAKARKYVVTPNLDHCVMLRRSASFRQAYHGASLITADGWPLVLASRTTDNPLPARVTGADLLLPLCEGCAREGLSVFLMGSALEVLCASATLLNRRFPGLRIAGVYSPPLGFDNDGDLLAEMDAVINAASPDILFVALGAPKQELWMHRHVPHLMIGGALGIGAAIDFIAGAQKRAPKFARVLCLEWLWRALSNPRRLGMRYLRDALWLPVLLWDHLLGRSPFREASPRSAIAR